MRDLMRGRAQAWIAAALFGVFLLGRVLIVLQGKVFTSYDTFSYAYRDDPVFNRGALVSFTGQAPRPWGVPLFFVLFPDDQSRAVAQWTVGTIAWILLAWSVSRFLTRPVPRLLAAGGILLIGLTGTVASWDFAILSESLSISLGVATLAFFLWWLRTNATWALIAMTVIAVWWTFTRVDMFVMLAPIGVALLIYAWRRRKSNGHVAVAAAAVLAFAAGWSYLVVGPNSLETHRDWSFAPDLSHERGLLMYRLRISVFPDPQVKEVFEQKLGMPKCAPADDLAAPGKPWAVDEFAAAVRTCPGLQAWTLENEGNAWADYAKTAPVLFTRQIGRLTSDSLAGAAYSETPALVPVPIEKLVFSKRYALPLSLGFLVLTTILALHAGGRRRQPHLLWTGVSLGAISLTSAVLTVIVSSGEVWRFGIQEAIAIRVAIVILLAVAVEGYIEAMRRSTRSS